MHLIEALCRLNAVDQEWDEKGRLYQVVRQRLADQSPLEAARQAQQARQAALSQKRGALRDGELELNALQEKVRQAEESLYGGRITSSRELENLRRDCEHLKQRIAHLEESLLDLMESVEALEREAAQGAAELAAFEARWAAEREADTALYHELRARLQALQEERERLRSQIEARALVVYDALRRTKGGTPLAPVRDGICQACRVSVPSGKAQMIERGDESIVLCEGCGRILYRG